MFLHVQKKLQSKNTTNFNSVGKERMDKGNVSVHTKEGGGGLGPRYFTLEIINELYMFKVLKIFKIWKTNLSTLSENILLYVKDLQ